MRCVQAFLRALVAGLVILAASLLLSTLGIRRYSYSWRSLRATLYRRLETERRSSDGRNDQGTYEVYVPYLS